MRSRTAFALAYTTIASTALVGACSLTSPELPDLTGMGLKAAQDAARERGFFDLRSLDGAGLGRSQLWDTSWIVCEQSPRPGVHDPQTTRVTLTVVHTGEVC